MSKRARIIGSLLALLVIGGCVAAATAFPAPAQINAGPALAPSTGNALRPTGTPTSSPEELHADPLSENEGTVITATSLLVNLIPTPTPSADVTATVTAVLASTLGSARIAPASRLTSTAVFTNTLFLPQVIVAGNINNGSTKANPAKVATPPSELVVDGQIRSAHVPMLMYHYLSEPPTGSDKIRRDLSVTPARFAAHLDRLQSEGYTTISLYALMDYLTHGAPLPAKPVILTFDDGYLDNYTNAFPLLKAHGMTATFFVITDFLDEKRPEYMSWEMAREMLAAGMSIESHGRNHANLAGRDRDYLVWQALGSMETLQFELGVRPRFICYPAGRFDL